MVLRIQDFRPEHLERVLDLSKRAWSPVFSQLQPATERFVFDAFYPDGWWERQKAEIEALVDDRRTRLAVATEDSAVLGFVGIRIHPEDRMGEIYILAVDPDHQRRGIGTALMDFAFAEIKKAGMAMVMVETGDDPGHAPSRATYESAGFKRWPVARYFREL